MLPRTLVVQAWRLDLASLLAPGDFKAGSGVAEATILFVFHFLPPPMAGNGGFFCLSYPGQSHNP